MTSAPHHGSAAPDDPVANLDALLDQLTGPPGAAAPPAGTTPGEPPAAAPEPMFDDLDAFVRVYLSRVVERRIVDGARGGVYWCASWWAHPEAISRLYAMWREWEKARIEDSMSTWWIHHFDPHLAALSGDLGPFSRCDSTKHIAPTPLPVKPAPASVLAELPDHTAHHTPDAGP